MRKNKAVSHIWPLLLIVTLSSFVTQCSRVKSFSNLLPKNVTLLVQNYWWAGEDGDHRIKNELPAVINGTKFKYDYIIIDEKMDALKIAQTQIKRTRNDVVILDPFLTLKVGDKILQSEKKSLFLVFLGDFHHDFSNDASYNNFVYVVFNTENTYRKAGEICAELINNNGKVSGKSSLSKLINRETKIGILYYSFSGKIKKEVESFKEGFLNYGNNDQLIDAKLNNLNNKQAVQHALRNLQEKGAGIFLLLTLNLTPYCLDILKKSDGIAVVEGADYADIYSNVILFSINNEPVEGIKEALKAFLNSSRKNTDIEIEASIQWGKLPKEEQSVP